MLKPKYNFHSHTYRCGHSDDYDDHEFVLEAISWGYRKYGISDHVPVHPIFYWDKRMRMHDREKEEYLSSIEELKKTYADSIEILSGFEAEYDEIIEAYLCDLRDKCDYMILGQHYILGKDIRHTVGYPLEYAKKVCKAIESGIFDIVAHPDIFMQYRYGIEEKDKDEYIENCKKASKKICEKAKEYDIPLELNLGGFYEREIESEPRYPTNLFWTEVSKVGNKVVVGLDTHSRDDINLANLKLSVIKGFINLGSLDILQDFDPVLHREKNDKLNNAYLNTKDNLSGVESRFVASFKSSDDLLKNLKFFPKRKGIKQKYFDCLTLFKREELIRVIKNCPDKDIVSFVDDYYSKKREKIKIKER